MNRMQIAQGLIKLQDLHKKALILSGDKKDDEDVVDADFKEV